MARRMLLLAVLMVLGRGAAAVASTNVFALPSLQAQHTRLVQEMAQQLRAGDFAAVESTCRAGLALLPDNANWHYNLACALSRQGRSDAALDELEQAIVFGFRDTAAIGRDADFESIRRLGRYRKLLEKARELGDTPPPGSAFKGPAPVEGRQVEVSASNTAWNFDIAFFQSFYRFPTNAPPATNPVVRVSGPAGNLVRTWYAEGTAAGNFGDLYDNRDRAHSRLNLGNYPTLTAIVYAPEARQFNIDYGVPGILHLGGPVIGNSSTAQTAGPFWRSNSRAALCDPRQAAFMLLQYLRNQLYFYPEHRDYDADNQGDVYPANAPFMVTSQGSSGSDQPFMNAFALTLAALRPEVKRVLAANGLITPTLQMVFRASQTSVTNRTDYLLGRTHPAVFDAKLLDPVRMVTLAHDLQTNALPPVALFKVTEEDPAEAGRDFFDGPSSEKLFDTPVAIARVYRSVRHERRMVLDASGSRDLYNAPITFHWNVWQGDPKLVRIRKLDDRGARVEITVTYHGGRFPQGGGRDLPTSRVDVGLVVDNGRLYSAPAFVSIYHLNNEDRVYDAAGRIQSVDYAAAAARYTDPMLSLPRRWKDVYAYDATGNLTGWTRTVGTQTETFTADGARVETTDARGRPATARTVRYLARSAGADSRTLPDIVAVDGDLRRTYRYASDNDRVGEIVSEEKAAP